MFPPKKSRSFQRHTPEFTKSPPSHLQEGHPAADAEGDPGHEGDGEALHEAPQGRRHAAAGAALQVSALGRGRVF